jgi:DNA-binding PadR family transcriptional regulator
MDCAKEALLVDSAIPGSWKRGGQIGSAGKAKEATPKDVFLSEIKTRDVFPLLILHMVRERPEYGNSLIRGVKDMTGGVMSVSPNTVYPLLRRLEEKGYVVGEWEKPETRSRRFYRITPRGENKYTEIRGRFEGHLLRVREAVETLHEELYGPKNEQAAS